jgi:pectinesterase
LTRQRADPNEVAIIDDRANRALQPAGTTWASPAGPRQPSANDLYAGNPSFANSFDEATHPEITNQPAVAG